MTPASILLVDDDPDVRQSVIACLSMSSLKDLPVLEAEDPTAGLTIFREHREQIGVILIDGLYGLGHELASSLLKEDCRCPLIAFTADVAYRAKMLMYGCITAIPKPFGWEELLQPITEALSEDHIPASR